MPAPGEIKSIDSILVIEDLDASIPLFQVTSERALVNASHDCITCRRFTDLNPSAPFTETMVTALRKAAEKCEKVKKGAKALIAELSCTSLFIDISKPMRQLEGVLKEATGLLDEIKLLEREAKCRAGN